MAEGASRCRALASVAGQAGRGWAGVLGPSGVISPACRAWTGLETPGVTISVHFDNKTSFELCEPEFSMNGATQVRMFGGNETGTIAAKSAMFVKLSTGDQMEGIEWGGVYRACQAQGQAACCQLRVEARLVPPATTPTCQAGFTPLHASDLPRPCSKIKLQGKHSLKVKVTEESTLASTYQYLVQITS